MRRTERERPRRRLFDVMSGRCADAGLTRTNPQRGRSTWGSGRPPTHGFRGTDLQRDFGVCSAKAFAARVAARRHRSESSMEVCLLRGVGAGPAAAGDVVIVRPSTKHRATALEHRHLEPSPQLTDDRRRRRQRPTRRTVAGCRTLLRSRRPLRPPRQSWRCLGDARCDLLLPMILRRSRRAVPRRERHVRW